MRKIMFFLLLCAVISGLRGANAELEGLRCDTGTVSRATGFFRIEQGQGSRPVGKRCLQSTS